MDRVQDLVNSLTHVSELYYSEGDSPLTDAQYDALENELRTLDPTNPFLIGVGATVRGDKVDLPFKMGSLNQLDRDEVESWVQRHKLQNEKFVITSKEDGVSLMLVYNSLGDLQIAYSRGDGHQGQDVTRHVRQMVDVPQKITKGPMAIRAEVIMADQTFVDLEIDYKNPRNYVAGKMNKEQSDTVFYDNVCVVAYEIVSPKMGKVDQMTVLKDQSFRCPKIDIVDKGSDLSGLFLESCIEDHKANSEFALDGVVVEVSELTVREKMEANRHNTKINPEFAFKFKINNEDNIAKTTIINVEWKVSKGGRLKPRIEVEPIDLQGVTIRHATAFNAQFVVDRSIGIGAEIEIVRAGDVIPYIQNVLQGVEAVLPDESQHGKWSWDENTVDIILDDVNASAAARLEQLKGQAKSIGLEFISTSGLEKLFEAGYENLADIILANDDEIYNIVGSKTAYKGMERLRGTLKNVGIAKLASTSGVFGRGMGERRMQKIVNHHGKLDGLTLEEVLAVEGFSNNTAEQFVLGQSALSVWLDKIDGHYNVIEKVKTATVGGEFAGMRIVCTGFRLKGEALEKFEAGGGEVQSSIRKDTTHVITADPTKITGKLKVAQEKGIEIMGGDDLLGRIR